MESRRLILVLSISLGVALLALGFLLGRESNRPSMSVVAAPPSLAASPRVETADPAPVPLDQAAATAAPAAARPRTAVDPADKQAVARYFQTVDPLQDTDVDNPEAAAGSLVAAASSGDSSGLRKLVAQARAAEDKARALTPPPACAHYHQRLIGVLADTREMFQQLERGVGGGNLDALPALLQRANGTKSRADALAKEERELKSRYGI